jgi:hypothetical protein
MTAPQTAIPQAFACTGIFSGAASGISSHGRHCHLDNHPLLYFIRDHQYKI